MSLYRGAGGASDATDDSTVNAVAGYASSAASSATAAAASASTASSNASAAAASAASAATNVSQAASSASNALTSASNASTSATNAASSASAAAGSATAANVSAGSAATSAANAATSNSSASTHATNAANSATAAASSATSAANSAASALAIYGNTAAMNEAVADAVEAAANAQQEAQDASDSAVASAASAAAADEHENNAAEWASQAQGSANSAQGFATAAQAARDATLEAYDNFDDRYLGVKTSDPTVDNDGNPLVPGALYFNSSTNMMMLRAGGVWVAAYTSGGSPSFGSIVVNGSGSFASGSASSPTITNIGSENTGLFFPSAFNLGFSTSGSERMRLNAVGNLGIGTVSPTALLDVNGTVNVTGVSTFSAGTAAAPAITTTGDTNTGIFFPAADTIAFSEGGVESMRINSAGNLGIGTTSPSNPLNIVRDNVAFRGQLSLQTVSASNFAQITFYDQTTFSGQIYQGYGTDKAIHIANPLAHGVAFWTNNLERMRLDSNGNLGIGTSSPAARLSVRSTGAQVDISTSTTQVSFEAIDRAAISNPVDMRFFARNGTFQWHNSSYAERMRLDASGNLGLGVTPSAWFSTWKAIQVGASGALSSRSDIFGTTLSQNSFINSAGNLAYIGTAAASRYSLIGAEHQWFTAPTGTAGNAISFTQAMTLDASGNLGVGTTSPAARLDVSGGTNSEMRLTTSGAGFLQVGQFTNGAYIGTSSADAAAGILRLGTASNTRATIDTAGNFGIGTTSPAYRLDVNGAANFGANVYHRIGGTPFVATSGGFTYYYGNTNGILWRNAADNVSQMALDASGNLGIGTTGPSARLNVVTAGTSLAQFTGAEYSQIRHSDGTRVLYTQVFDNAAIFGTESSTPLLFVTGGTERARIDSIGNLLVGKSASNGGVAGIELAPAGQLVATRSGGSAGYFNRLASDGALISLNRSNAEVGTISVTTTATAYNTSSDYRLKNITGPVTNSGAYIDSLNPVEGTWKADGSTFVGLIAHEVQEASRTQVATGVKDGEQMQGMDYSNSELIANLIAEVKSLRARVAALESN